MIKEDVERINLLGCPVDNLGFEETILLIDEIIRQKIPRQHVGINASKLLQVRSDSDFAKNISSCDIINPDGMPIVWASRVLGKCLKEKIAGIDLMEALIAHSAQKGYRIFFLGARDEIVKKLVGVCKSRYPELQVAGYRSGYWEASEEEGVVDLIRRSHSDIIFVGISTPKKEIFLSKNLANMGVAFAMGVGGAFDVLAGKIKRAPVLFQKCGLEWFWRLIQEPRRMWKRYLIGNTIFIWLIVKELFMKKLLRRSLLRGKKRS